MTATTHPFEATYPQVAGRIRESLKEAGKREFMDISFQGIELANGGVDFVRQLLASHASTVRHLSFADCKLSDADMQDVADIVAESPQLKTLNLGLNSFTHTGLPALATAVAQKGGLESFSIPQNPLGEGAGAPLASIVEHSPQLSVFEISSSQLRSSDIRQVTQALGHSEHVSGAYFAYNNTSQDIAPDIADFLKQNRSLTHISIGPMLHDAKAGQALDAVFKDLWHPNLLRADFSPQKAPYAEAFTEKNKQNIAALRPQIEGTGDLAQLSQDILNRIAEREEGIFTSIRDDIRSTEQGEVYKAIKSRYEGFMDSLPPLPEAGAGFGEALFSITGNGFAPLDNPRIQRQGEVLLDRLQSAGTPITTDFLTRKTPRGSSVLDTLSRALPGEMVVPFLNGKGIKLGTAALVEDKGREVVPSPLLETFIERGNTASLFTHENWAGKQRGELFAVCKALPSTLREQVPMQQISSRMQSATVMAGRGR